MGFFDFFRSKSASADPPRALEQLVDLLNLGGVSAEKLSEATYFACMKILGESLGKLPLKLLRHDPDAGVISARGHPLYGVVGTRPNPYMTATHFWSTVEYNRNEYGNGYVWIRGAGSGLTLWVLRSDCVECWIDDKGLWGAPNAVCYVYTDPRGAGRVRIPHDSMLHFKTSSSFDGITGRAVRDILSATLDGNLTAQDMLNRAYRNGFVGKAVLQYTGQLSDANEKLYAKKMEEYVRGDEGLDKIIPMAFGTTLTPITAKLADNQFIELKKYSALQIAAAFGIKPNQINDYEKSSYASAEAQQLAFYVDTLLYIIKQYEEELTYKLLSEEERLAGYYFKFNVAAILRADQKTQLEALKNAVSGGIYTPNEARAFLDKEGKPGGDQLIVNGTMIPLAIVGSQYGGDENGT